jgi:acetolactate synthase-1/2/3 large subunit
MSAKNGGNPVIKVSDYIVRRIAELGVGHVFLVTGGGAMHLNDSLGRCKDLTYVCNHHEQASAFAMEAYARLTGNIGVAMVTSGPGGTNTVTGVLGCWLDSIPGLFISGQIKYSTTVESTGLPLRQLGDQEADIISIVKSITKYAVMVKDPLTIRYHFERAVYLARHGRPGPVWLDIPLNVQSALVEESSLIPYDSKEDELSFSPDVISDQVSDVIRRIRAAERPLLLAGGGVRLSGSFDLFRQVIELLNIPVQTAIGAMDLLESDHPLFLGRPSVTGDRSSNFIIQNADLLFSLGARLWVRQISYNYAAFAREAFKIAVDVDAAELKKPTLSLDKPIHCDVNMFLKEMLRQLEGKPLSSKVEWMSWCRERRHRYPSVIQEYRDEQKYVNTFYFVELLSRLCSPGQVVVLADGLANTCTFQSFFLKKGQRVFTNSGCAAMGFCLPSAVGACFASGKKNVICITGDGSIQLNIQELQTIVHHQLPVKIFVYDNDGYTSIRLTQDAYFEGRYMGADPSSGVSFPDMRKIAHAYGLSTAIIHDHEGLEEKVRSVLETDGPVLCVVRVSPKQAHLPKLASEVLPTGGMVSKPLEDMFPFLDRKEFMENMIVKPWDPSGKAK